MTGPWAAQLPRDLQLCMSDTHKRAQPAASLQAPLHKLSRQQPPATPKAPVALQGGCGLTVGGYAVTYSQCSTVDAGTAYNLYYTLTPSGASAVMAVGIAANSDGWVGIGFPQSGQEMVGTDSIIAKADASSPTGEAWSARPA